MAKGSSNFAPRHAEIVRELTHYMIDFVEQPRPELGNLPICPFARKARLEKRIRFEVIELARDRILDLAQSLTENSDLQVMIFVHPSKDGLSYTQIRQLVMALNEELSAMNLIALGLHPEDPFNIDGLYTRREPYPNIQLIRLEEGERAHEIIKNSGYYDRWTESNLRDCLYSREESLALIEDRIVREFSRYITDFVEQPHPKLANLPICPFARKARTENRVRFKVMELTHERLLDLVPSFAATPQLHVLVCIDPRKDMSCAEVHRLVKTMNRALPALNLMALGGHPEDPFNIDGLYTRRDPFPNVQIIRLDIGERAYLSIRNSGYYDRWTESNFRDVVPASPPALSEVSANNLRAQANSRS